MTTSETSRHYSYMVTAFGTDNKPLDVSAYAVDPHITDGYTLNFSSGKAAATLVANARSGRLIGTGTGRKVVAYLVMWLRWDDAVGNIPEVYVTPAGRRFNVQPIITGRTLTDDDLAGRIS